MLGFRLRKWLSPYGDHGQKAPFADALFRFAWQKSRNELCFGPMLPLLRGKGGA